MRRREKDKYVKSVVAIVGIFLFLQTDFAKSLSQFFFASSPKRVESPSNHDSIIRKFADESFDSGQENQEDEVEVECPIPHLKHRIELESSARNPKCSRIPPVPGSCTVARYLFDDPPILECESKEFTLCRIQGTGTQVKVICNIELCALPVVMGTVQPENGSLHWENFQDQTSLQSRLINLVASDNIQQHFGFCFLKCLKKEYEDYMYDVIGKYDKSNGIPMYDDLHSHYYISQLMILPPVIKETRKTENKLNINMIFIDSVSRHHFYRTLPKSVKVLESINLKHKNGHPTMVLDFELVQSMRSRTFESLQALFSGYVNPSEKPFGVLEMPPLPLATEGLFGPFKSQGYHTLWLEDLCWEWEWGISKDLRAFNKSLPSHEIWKKLKMALNRAGIDSLDTTLSSCEILRVNNVNDHFHGPDTVCYGGKYQHQFAFEYLNLYQSLIASQSQQFFTFLETNVGHEDTGARIRTLDQSLADHLQFASTLTDTLTILFSDHGNSYGNFIDESVEGRVELFHPFLMMVLPEKIHQKLEESQVSALITNQNRLVSLLDLHHMLHHIASGGGTFNNMSTLIRNQFSVPVEGLLSKISPSRTCDQMPRIMPNLCICEGYENTVKNDSHYAIFAHLALGKLNEVLHFQYRKGSPQSVSPFGRCRRLVLHSFSNVKINYEKNNTKYVKMDLHVKLSDETSKEVFFVAIKYSDVGQKSIELTKFDRITPYSGYKICADPGVDLNLCVCNIKDITDQAFSMSDIPSTAVLAQSKVSYLDESVKCLYLLSTQNDHGAVLEAFNLCSFQTFKLTLKSSTRNLLQSSRTPLSILLNSYDVKLLITAVQINPQDVISWKYKIAVTSV